MRLKFFFSMLAAAAIALTGCNKDQTELEINYGKSAIVKGKVILNDGTSTTKAGANIKVYAQINIESYKFCYNGSIENKSEGICS